MLRRARDETSRIEARDSFTAHARAFFRHRAVIIPRAEEIYTHIIIASSRLLEFNELVTQCQAYSVCVFVHISRCLRALTNARVCAAKEWRARAARFYSNAILWPISSVEFNVRIWTCVLIVFSCVCAAAAQAVALHFFFSFSKLLFVKCILCACAKAANEIYRKIVYRCKNRYELYSSEGGTFALHKTYVYTRKEEEEEKQSSANAQGYLQANEKKTFEFNHWRSNKYVGKQIRICVTSAADLFVV